MINQLDEGAVKAMYQNMVDILLWGGPEQTEEEKYKDDITMGMVMINGKQEMLNVHMKDMKAYKTGEWYSLIEPLEEVKYDSFVRWCQGMDF